MTTKDRVKRFVQKRKPILIFIAVFAALFVLGEFLLNYFSIEELFAQAPIVARTTFFFVIVIEVIIAPIPGGLLGYLGAVHFGFWHAWILLYFANVVGTITVFFLARRLGRPFLEKSTSQEERDRYDKLLSDYPWMLYVVYAVPLFPIDVISILAGVSKVSAKRFLPIATVGLITYTGIIALLGAFFGEYVPYVENLTFAAMGLLVFGVVWALKKFSFPAKKEKKKEKV